MDPRPTSPNPMAARSSQAAGGAVSSVPPDRGVETMIAPGAQADAVHQEIRTHLGEGRYRKAQRLAKEAAARFPDHPGIRTMNRGLNDWRVTTHTATGVDRTEEYAWMRNPPESVRGKWVALVGSEVAAAADTLAEVIEILRPRQLPKPALMLRVE